MLLAISLICSFAFICFLHAYPGWNSGKLNKCRLHLCQLGEKLVQPYLHTRSQNLVGVRRTIQDAMAACIVPLTNQANMPRKKQPKAKRKQCYRCSMEHKDRKTVCFCNKCQHPVCADTQIRKKFLSALNQNVNWCCDKLYKHKLSWNKKAFCSTDVFNFRMGLQGPISCTNVTKIFHAYEG